MEGRVTLGEYSVDYIVVVQAKNVERIAAVQAVTAINSRVVTNGRMKT